MEDLPQTFRNVEPVLIPVKDKRVFATLHHSKTGDFKAAVLFLHGFNSSKSDRFRFSYDLAQRLSDVGITSLRIDFRGCGESDGRFSDMTIRSQVEDAKAAINYLHMGHQKIGILGRSLGAGIGLIAAKESNIDSLVLFSPVFDGKDWKNIPKGAGIGGIHPGDEFLNEMGDLSVADALAQLAETPILHIHAGSDEILSSNHRESYLKHSSINHQYKLIENADHTYSKPEHRKILGKESLQWFIKTLI